MMRLFDERPPMTARFKVGDRIECVGTAGPRATGTVTFVDYRNRGYRIRFDDGDVAFSLEAEVANYAANAARDRAAGRPVRWEIRLLASETT